MVSDYWNCWGKGTSLDSIDADKYVNVYYYTLKQYYFIIIVNK